MGDDIDSMLNEEEKHIEAEELKEERERGAAGRKRGKIPRSAPLGMDEDVVGIGDLEPAELGRIDHHAEAGRMIEEKITLPLGATSPANKKKISVQKRQVRESPAKKKAAAGDSTKKQKERYSKE